MCESERARARAFFLAFPFLSFIAGLVVPILFNCRPREKNTDYFIFISIWCARTWKCRATASYVSFLFAASARFSHSSDLLRFYVRYASAQPPSHSVRAIGAHHRSSHISARSPLILVALFVRARSLLLTATANTDINTNCSRSPFILAMFFGVFSMDAKCFLFACSISLFAAAVLRFSRASVPHKFCAVVVVAALRRAHLRCHLSRSTCGQMAV